jgi:hypothetical protein
MDRIGALSEPIGARRRVKDSETLQVIFSRELRFAKHQVINRRQF